MNVHPTKQKVVDTASALFFQKGFHGTSVRDIAKGASVNVSLISYYFNGKQGLLEYAVTNYYEHYLTYLDEKMNEYVLLGHAEKLKIMIEAILQYKSEHFKLTSFIQRELSLDSTFVREMTVTYLAKENHLLRTIFFPLLDKEDRVYRYHLFMQLKGMLLSPYLFKQEWYNQLVDPQAFRHFVQSYIETIHLWIDFLTAKKIEN